MSSHTDVKYRFSKHEAFGVWELCVPEKQLLLTRKDTERMLVSAELRSCFLAALCPLLRPSGCPCAS
eukprot:8913909-Pyramimonas_sp.AAC.1